MITSRRRLFFRFKRWLCGGGDTDVLNRHERPLKYVDRRKQGACYLVGLVKRRATRIRPKAVRSGIFCRFANFDTCRSEAAGDVIFGMALDSVGTDARTTFGESGLNIGRII